VRPVVNAKRVTTATSGPGSTVSSARIATAARYEASTGQEKRVLRVGLGVLSVSRYRIRMKLALLLYSSSVRAFMYDIELRNPAR
jgi:hypothetical protein